MPSSREVALPRRLRRYEKWLGSRKVDAPYVLRYVARAVLVETARQKPVTASRIDALAALAADGDQDAATTLDQAMSSQGFAETRVLASMGSTKAVKALIAQLDSMPGSKTPVINALGASGNKLAVPPLKALLADPNDLNRAAAAEALGQLGATETIRDLIPLLKDQVFTVRLKAAGALYRLNDPSGMSLLMELTGSEHAAIRIAAAAELAAQPDANWQSLVRSLATDPDPHGSTGSRSPDRPLRSAACDQHARWAHARWEHRDTRVGVRCVRRPGCG